MNIAPDPILKAGLMTPQGATVFGRNLACCSDVPVSLFYELMDAIHDVPNTLLHWNDEHSLEMLITHLACFNREAWIQRLGNGTDVPDLVAFFRARLEDFGSDAGAER